MLGSLKGLQIKFENNRNLKSHKRYSLLVFSLKIGGSCECTAMFYLNANQKGGGGGQ